MKHHTCIIVLAALGLFSTLTANAQSPDMVADVAARVNNQRTTRGMIPYAFSAQLALAAQNHANDVAKSGKLSHIGSDGSTVFQRVARTGYGSYAWGRRVGENWAWYHSPSEALDMWMKSAPHRENILHTVYREFGVGVAPYPAGGYVFVLVFGAQPNVLPVFIENGGGSTTSANVTLALSDELAAPFGDTGSAIGHPTEVQISNDPAFSGAHWQPYGSRIPWKLATNSSKAAVYVKYRDARGRTATSGDSIILGAPAVAKNTAPPTVTKKPTVTVTRTRKPSVTPTQTPRPTLRPSRTPTETRMPTVPQTDVSTLSTALLDTEPTGTPTAAASEPPPDTATPELDDPATEPSTRVAYVPATRVAVSTAIPIVPIEKPSDRTDPLALGVFTVAVAAGIMAIVKYKARR